MKKIFYILFVISPLWSYAQTNAMYEPLPYYEIPPAPDTYNSCTVAARMLDGLGFRYYWATEGLKEEDLGYRPDSTARTCKETLEHIHGLTLMALNAVNGVPNGITTEDPALLSYEELRKQTLLNIEAASTLLKSSKPEAIEQMNIIFKRRGQESSFPFWNLINGPLEDAVWHVGQVVSFRRASGNPISPKISLFRGTVRD